MTMPVVDIVDITNNKVGETSLNDDIFGVEVNPFLIHEVVKMQLANRRSGTASTKNRSLVRGGGKKPWKQKGTGRARVGSIRSPLWKGGGTIFGPMPRDYSYLVPKKVRKNALKAALSQKLQENKLVLVDAITLDEVKSKKFVALMKTFKITNALIIDEENKNLSLSARNVTNFKVLKPEGLNVFDLMVHDHVVLTKPSLESIEKRLLA
ncbi:MAG TPA: 50S ribosomal protein L4 [Thermodesulfobacteriota bacterium]|nr:50S ribosomal protein L4 [Thermodesulfobacteriota bacterium]